MNRGKELSRLIVSKGWQAAKDMLTERIMDIQSVMNIEGKTAEEVLADIKLRQNLIVEMKEWINDIEGTARQYEANLVQPPVTEKDHIERE